MKLRANKSGFSLTELLVVMAIVGILAGIGLPAVKQVVNSFESATRIYDVVGAALSNARSMAHARTKYIGIRFQTDSIGQQYMVFIEHDYSATRLANGFRAMKGKSPIRLPKHGLVMDMNINMQISVEGEAPDQSPAGPLNDDDLINTPQEIRDATAFSIIFSPAGKLVQHDVRIRNVGDNDMIFNKNYEWETDLEPAEYVQPLLFIDDYPAEGLGQELSRKNFVVVEKNKINSIPPEQRWSRYLKFLQRIYVAPYSGELLTN